MGRGANKTTSKAAPLSTSLTVPKRDRPAKGIDPWALAGAPDRDGLVGAIFADPTKSIQGMIHGNSLLAVAGAGAPDPESVISGYLSFLEREQAGEDLSEFELYFFAVTHYELLGAGLLTES